MGRQVKWTQIMRLDLYRRLQQRFGPSESGYAPQEPTRSTYEYDEFLRELTAHFLKNYGERFTINAIKN
jgi:hypothetical protein